MPNIALVEDEPEAADVLASFIARYAGEKGLAHGHALWQRHGL